MDFFFSSTREQKFTPSKEQKRSLRKFEEYLNGSSSGCPPEENASSREKSSNAHVERNSKSDEKASARSSSLQEIEYFQSVLNKSISEAKRKRKLPDIDFDVPMVRNMSAWQTSFQNN